MDFGQEELLIEEVRERQYLYDKSSRDYSDKQKRINAFSEIGLVMGFTGIPITLTYLACHLWNKLIFSGDTVMSKWESLKKQYQQYLGKLKNPSGSGAKKIPLFRHSKTMSFLQSHFRSYRYTSKNNSLVHIQFYLTFIKCITVRSPT